MVSLLVIVVCILLPTTGSTQRRVEQGLLKGHRPRRAITQGPPVGLSMAVHFPKSVVTTTTTTPMPTIQITSTTPIPTTISTTPIPTIQTTSTTPIPTTTSTTPIPTIQTTSTTPIPTTTSTTPIPTIQTTSTTPIPTTTTTIPIPTIQTTSTTPIPTTTTTISIPTIQTTSTTPIPTTTSTTPIPTIQTTSTTPIPTTTTTIQIPTIQTTSTTPIPTTTSTTPIPTIQTTSTTPIPTATSSTPIPTIQTTSTTPIPTTTTTIPIPTIQTTSTTPIPTTTSTTPIPTIQTTSTTPIPTTTSTTPIPTIQTTSTTPIPTTTSTTPIPTIQTTSTTPIPTTTTTIPIPTIQTTSTTPIPATTTTTMPNHKPLLKKDNYHVPSCVPQGEAFVTVKVTTCDIKDLTSNRSESDIIIPHVVNWDVNASFALDGCSDISYKKISSRDAGPRYGASSVGYFYTHSPCSCPTQCVVALIWSNTRGIIKTDSITITPFYKEAWICPKELPVETFGTNNGCRRPAKERGMCLDIPHPPPLLELRGPDADKFFIVPDGSVYSRGDTVSDKNTNAVLSVGTRFSKITTEVQLQMAPYKSSGRNKGAVEGSSPPWNIQTPLYLACPNDDIKTMNLRYLKNLFGYPIQIITTKGIDQTDEGYYECKYGNRTSSVPFKLTKRHYPLCAASSDTVDVQSDSTLGALLGLREDVRWALKLYLEALFRYESFNTTDYGITKTIRRIERRKDGGRITVDWKQYGNCNCSVPNVHPLIVPDGWLEEARRDSMGFLTGSLYMPEFEGERDDAMRIENDGMTLMHSNGFLQLSCTFVSCVEHRNTYDMSWTLNGDKIDTSGHNSSFLANNIVLVRQKQVLCTIEKTRMVLILRDFRQQSFGEYRCVLRVAYGQRVIPWVVNASTLVGPQNPIVRGVMSKPPTLKVFPKEIINKPGSNVSFTCQTDYGHRMEIRQIKQFANWTVDILKDIRLDDNNQVLSVVITLPEGRSEIDCRVFWFETTSEIHASVTLKEHLKSYDQVPTECPISTDAMGTAWPAAPSGAPFQLPCPKEFSGFITRHCNASGTWRRPSYLRCTRTDLNIVSDLVNQLSNDRSVDVTKDVVEDVTRQVSLSVNASKPTLSGDLAGIIRIMSNLSQAVTNSSRKDVVVTQNALENLASTTDELLSSDTKVWTALEEDETEDYNDNNRDDNGDDVKTRSTNSGNELWAAMDSLVKSSLKDPAINNSRPIVKENIVISRAIVKSTNDIRFPESQNEVFYREHDSWAINSTARAFLPASAFRNQNKADVEYAVILYKQKDKRFRASGDNTQSEIASIVLSFSTTLESKEIASELELKFFSLADDGMDLQCAYLDTEIESGMKWTSKYCRTENDGEGRVRCYCQHLTNFAVLMSPVMDKVHHKALSTISLIGCVVSIICLIVTLLVYGTVWKNIQCSRSALHVCLCGSLLVAYVVLLAGIERTENWAGCLVVTVLLHYSLLVAFFIMMTEGVELYLRVKVVFTRKSLGWKLYAPAFVLPFVIVGVTMGSTWDRGYMSKDFCWLNMESGALWSFLGPIGCVLLGNTIITVLVVKVLLSTHSMINQAKRQKIKAALRAICVISPLLGFTWILGLLALNNHAIALYYAFVICNSLQGLAIFVFQCIMTKQVQDAIKLKWRILRSRYQSSLLSTGGATATFAPTGATNVPMSSMEGCLANLSMNV